jgi:hypothetical protein
MKISKFFAFLVLFLASFSSVHASELEVNCSDEPGKNLCWQMKNISVDLRECTNREFWNKARLSHRLTMFAAVVNMLPMRFNVSNEVITVADEAKEAIAKLNPNCEMKSGDLRDLMRDSQTRADFREGLDLLSN